MSLYQPTDCVPLWALFAGTILIVLLAVETGISWAPAAVGDQNMNMKRPFGAMTASTLALLAFMLAFTFGMAASRFDTRRDLVLEEANAIGTTYLRAQMMPEPYRSEICGLLREYAATRAEGAQKASLLVGRDRKVLAGRF